MWRQYSPDRPPSNIRQQQDTLRYSSFYPCKYSHEQTSTLNKSPSKSFQGKDLWPSKALLIIRVVTLTHARTTDKPLAFRAFAIPAAIDRLRELELAHLLVHICKVLMVQTLLDGLVWQEQRPVLYSQVQLCHLLAVEATISGAVLDRYLASGQEVTLGRAQVLLFAFEGRHEGETGLVGSDDSGVVVRLVPDEKGGLWTGGKACQEQDTCQLDDHVYELLFSKFI